MSEQVTEIKFGDSRLPERFWDKVHPEPMTGCWLWTAGCDKDGYGKFSVNNPKRGERAHRTMAMASLRRFLVPSNIVMHSCDVPGCVNPSHLSVGTYLENDADRAAKGRAARGERHRLAKVAAADVLVIRERAAKGEPYNSIAKDYELGNTQVRNIIHRRKWKHVD